MTIAPAAGGNTGPMPRRQAGAPSTLSRSRSWRQAADWELAAELEYWRREIADLGDSEPAGLELLEAHRDACANELERRSAVAYARQRAPYADLSGVIEAVRQRADLVALFDRHCERRPSYSRQPSRLVYFCFLHPERAPSLTVYVDQGRWWCFSCRNGGDAIGAYMKLSDVSFVAAVLALAAECGVAVPERPKRGIKVGPR